MIKREKSLLMCIDFQERLMPAIDGAADITVRAQKLVEIARFMNIPRIFTEENSRWLGPTVASLDLESDLLLRKQFFNATAEETFPSLASDAKIIVTGCEAHVCVLQTVMGLLSQGREVYVVQDAIGSRRREDKDVAIQRMAKSGAEVVTYEMVAFEWLRTAEDPLFRSVLKMIK